MKVGGTTDARDLAGLREFGSHGNRIGGLTLAVEIEDRAVDRLMRRTVEVSLAYDLNHIGDGILAQQHGTDDGLFCCDVVRGSAI